MCNFEELEKGDQLRSKDGVLWYIIGKSLHGNGLVYLVSKNKLVKIISRDSLKDYEIER